MSYCVGDGIEVTPVDASGNKEAPMRHVVVLTGLYADTPARMKVANTVGSASAYLACQWCNFAGTKSSASEAEAGDTGRAMLFRGYSKPAQVSAGPLAGTDVQIHHPRNDHPQRVLTSAKMCRRGEMVEAGRATAKNTGCLGQCMIMKELPYTDYVNFFMLPFGHTVFLGVVKDFLHLLLDPSLPFSREVFVVNNEARKRIKEAEASFVLTSDFGRSYMGVDKFGQYVMENWCRFVEVFSVFLFSQDVHGMDVLPPLAKKAWGHLRRFVMYHMRGYAHGGVVAANKARMEILEFAKLMDDHYPRACKLNLHLLVCRLHLQEQQRGPVYLELEYWVERLIQLCKCKVRYRTHEYPEKVVANFLLETAAVEQYKAEFPRVEKVVQLITGAAGSTRDAYLDSTAEETHMIGTGAYATPEIWEQTIKPAFVAFCGRAADDNTGTHWATVDASALDLASAQDATDNNKVRVMVYTQAFLRGEEIVTSCEHRRSRTRESCYVTTSYDIGGENMTYIAVIKKLVKLVHIVDDEEHCLRFALCDFFRRSPPGATRQFLVEVKDQDTGDLWKVMRTDESRSLSDTCYLVEMSTIATKVVKCVSPFDGGKTLYFLPYSFSSGLL